MYSCSPGCENQTFKSSRFRKQFQIAAPKCFSTRLIKIWWKTVKIVTISFQNNTLPSFWCTTLETFITSTWTLNWLWTLLEILLVHLTNQNHSLDIFHDWKKSYAENLGNLSAFIPRKSVEYWSFSQLYPYYFKNNSSDKFWKMFWIFLIFHYWYCVKNTSFFKKKLLFLLKTFSLALFWLFSGAMNVHWHWDSDSLDFWLTDFLSTNSPISGFLEFWSRLWLCITLLSLVLVLHSMTLYSGRCPRPDW